MSEVIYRKIDVDEKAIQAKVENLIDDKIMLEIHNLYAKMMDPYVPFLEGVLAQSTEINTKGTAYAEPKGVHYIQPYAHRQYHGSEFNHTLDYHPLATAYWDEAMMRDKGDEFKKQVENILRRKAKELYG